MNDDLTSAEPIDAELVSSTELINTEETHLVSLDDRNTGIIELKEKLVKEYHKTNESLLKKIANCKGNTIEGILDILLEEMIKSSDDLLGTRILFTRENKLHDAATIGIKRTEIIEKMASLIGKKFDIISKSNAIDLGSPVFQVFQQICVDKLKEALTGLDLENDLKQLIIIKWGDKMTEWESELKSRTTHLNIKFL